jgi:sulfur relay (sulfurtransferase) DsrC/TusE family protein
MGNTVDFKKLDKEAFLYLTYLGKAYMAYETDDWKELSNDNELKKDYELYIVRRDLWEDKNEPLGFAEYFTLTSNCWSLLFILRELSEIHEVSDHKDELNIIMKDLINHIENHHRRLLL